MASFQAAGSAYAFHGLPMIPFYIFYSIFGFQRVGDMIWSCGDIMCRGFLLGGTAGRTTLNGEGLQHQDGHSHVMASTIPSMKSYDPAFAYELAIIIREGIRRMYQQQENVMYYITLYNETYSMPPMSNEADIHDGILRGGYRCQKSRKTEGVKIHLLSSGSIMQQALRARDKLETKGFSVDIWSITSFIELERDINACDRWNRLNPQDAPKIPYAETIFKQETGVFVAATDYMKTLANGISQAIPGPYQVLGTDGYGLSESRGALRDHFEISADYIAHAALVSLYKDGKLDKQRFNENCDDLNINNSKQDPVSR
jgi:pyruvate dehydrogenase E1 component